MAQEEALRDLLAARILEPFSAAMAEPSGALHRAMERKGLRRPAFDLLIAAHALHRDAAVATLDRDYEGIQGLNVVNVKA